MDNSFHRQETDTRRSPGFLAGFHIINSILNWLAGLLKLTEEEQTDAGIYLGNEQMDAGIHLGDERNK
jgi:hypothetical protein